MWATIVRDRSHELYTTLTGWALPFLRSPWVLGDSWEAKPRTLCGTFCGPLTFDGLVQLAIVVVVARLRAWSFASFDPKKEKRTQNGKCQILLWTLSLGSERIGCDIALPHINTYSL